ncbi:MAG: sterol desaturase family protein [Bacteroidota bacterium]|nr:sterol desaturase family protein [Bacteroidota bacterium]
MDLLTKLGHKFIGNLGVEAFRYIVFAGAAFLLLYVLGRSFFARFKIQQKFPERKQMLREIKYSFLSLCIFALNGVVVLTAYDYGYTHLYMKFSDHSVGYFIFSVFAFIIAHDTYFYWTHRLLHHKKIYPVVHKLHHLSHDPTPWAAYAFHPLEAVVQAGIFPIMVFLIPVHPLALLTWGLFQVFLYVMGHSGFELFPAGFTSGKISKWHNTSTHHNMHHKYANSNYGLYFNFWDRIMDTNHAKYNQQFEEVKARSKNLRTLAPEPIIPEKTIAQA